jgi:hypothetical protein
MDKGAHQHKRNNRGQHKDCDPLHGNKRLRSSARMRLRICAQGQMTATKGWIGPAGGARR